MDRGYLNVKKKKKSECILREFYSTGLWSGVSISCNVHACVCVRCPAPPHTFIFLIKRYEIKTSGTNIL